MKKRKSILAVFILTLGIKFFACPHFEQVGNNGGHCPLARVYINDTLPELIDGQKVYGENIPGVVFFEGFDFPGYTAESDGIEAMLEETYLLLQEYYAENKTPFVFLGHSQGGLRSLAMSTYLRNKDPELYKQLRGVVTISGIDKGLKLLENRGANFRAGVYTDVSILVNGIYGTVKVFDFTPENPLYEFVIDMLGATIVSDASYIFVDLLLCNWLSFTKDFAKPIMRNTLWDQHAQIRDMCPQSDFIKDYVLEEKPYYCKVACGSKNTIVWKKGWFGISYPTIKKETAYKTIQTSQVNIKVDKDLPLNFIIGTNNDTLSMCSKEVSDGVDVGMKVTGAAFTAAGLAHVAKTVAGIGLFTNSPVYAYDCGKAAYWCFNYKDQIAELIGESASDGLVAQSCQQLPAYSKVGSSEKTQVLNKSNRNSFYRNHSDIVEIGSLSRNKVNDYADQLLGITDRGNKKR